MKKLFTTMVAALATFVASATDYTDQLVVTVNGTASPAQETTVSVDQAEDGTYALSLNNFILNSDGAVIPVGNIYVDGVEGSTTNGVTSFATTRTIRIAEGTLEGVLMWMGPQLGDVPIVLSATMTDTQLYFQIDIDMTASLQQTINVVFGSPIEQPADEPVATTQYTDMLSVKVNGVAMPDQQALVIMTQAADGTYGLALNNLVLSMGETVMPVGNIALSGLEGQADGDVVALATVDTIQIAAGTLEGVPMWWGPQLGDVPIDMRGELRGDKLYFVIDIEMASLQQTISVVFGHGGYQISNGGFEQFHTATYTSSGIFGGNTYTSDEPNHWHSFMSSTGSMAGVVSSTPHTFIGTDVRPGTLGTSSVLVTSGSIFGIVANGTITTGRMNAGNMNATNTDNHAFLDITNTDVDANGDPFYTLINGEPDSVAVWVKFKQGAPNDTYPYATVNAVITDGTRYQDPEDKAYTNVVAKATNAQIATNDYQWQRLSIPFDYATYAANNADTKAMLVTISTNAQPGAGSGTDSLYVDDFELIYNLPYPTAININGAAVEGVDTNIHEYELKVEAQEASVSSVEVEDDGAWGGITLVDTQTINDQHSQVTITMLSGDLKLKSQYVVNYMTAGYANGITNAGTNAGTHVVATYNLSGQRVSHTTKGQVYIQKLSNGTTIKAIAK